MRRSVLSVLNVKREEEAQVILMLTVGFFMGIFLATYHVTAESLFINKLKDHNLSFYTLSNAILASGVLGILATLIFSFAQNRVRYSNLTITSILSVVLLSSALYFLLQQNVALFTDIDSLV